MKRLITLLACAVMSQDVVGQIDAKWIRGNNISIEVKKGVHYGENAIYISHYGSRLQYSTNSIDWDLVDTCEDVIHGCGINQFHNSIAFLVGGFIPKSLVGVADWDLGEYVGPEITKFFVRLHPDDVSYHKESHRSSKIRFSVSNQYEEIFYKLSSYKSAIRSNKISLEWDYGVLQIAESLDKPEWKLYKWQSNYFTLYPTRYDDGVYKNSNTGVFLRDTGFFRLRPLDKDIDSVFYIDLDEGFFHVRPKILPHKTRTTT